MWSGQTYTTVLNNIDKFGWMGSFGASGRFGVNVVYHKAQDTAYEWPTWQRVLYDFAPGLFKK